MKTYKRTDKEIIDAMNYIKSQFNGELPYQFGTFECAKMMAAYVEKLASDGGLADVIVPKGTVCGNCGCESYTRGLNRKEICQRCGEDWPQTAL